MIFRKNYSFKNEGNDMYKYESELVDNFIYLKNFQNEYIKQSRFRWANIDLVETPSFAFFK
ncbi:hypothetical protein MUO_13630 [Listeria monocytogenes 07PF0776]|nr:hypothetical protein MUO_13630 [Listeria monocytogenes 07PF0776]